VRRCIPIRTGVHVRTGTYTGAYDAYAYVHQSVRRVRVRTSGRTTRTRASVSAYAQVPSVRTHACAQYVRTYASIVRTPTSVRTSVRTTRTHAYISAYDAYTCVHQGLRPGTVCAYASACVRSVRQCVVRTRASVHTHACVAYVSEGRREGQDDGGNMCAPVCERWGVRTHARVRRVRPRERTTAYVWRWAWRTGLVCRGACARPPRRTPVRVGRAWGLRDNAEGVCPGKLGPEREVGRGVSEMHEGVERAVLQCSSARAAAARWA
jgi:hypothetical protein